MVPSDRYTWAENQLVAPEGLYRLGDRFASAGSVVPFDVVAGLGVTYRFPKGAKGEIVYIVQPLSGPLEGVRPSARSHSQP